MKIIDLLNKIANGEEVPKEFKYHNHIFRKNRPFNYENEKGGIFEEWIVLEDLNEEIEILDEPKEDKIEKLDQTLNRLDINNDYYRYIMENRFKINELIDEVNKLKVEK